VKLAQVLFSQGFGSRRECEGLILGGFVSVAGAVMDDPFDELDPEGLQFSVRGETWPFRTKALIVLNKPAGHECSQKPKHHPSVYSLLGAPLRRRDVQAVGRLDEDTTGLLLLTDDGSLIHRWTSPKHHVPKVYEVQTARPVEPRQVQRLLDGVVLDDDPKPVRAEHSCNCAWDACEHGAKPRWRQRKLNRERCDRRRNDPGERADQPTEIDECRLRHQ
jgi:16S rRNA pseudouridine516 synthase